MATVTASRWTALGRIVAGLEDQHHPLFLAYLLQHTLQPVAQPLHHLPKDPRQASVPSGRDMLTMASSTSFQTSSTTPAAPPVFQNPRLAVS